MIRAAEGDTLYDIRLLRKDVGVAMLVLLALALAFMLRAQATARTVEFQDEATPFRLAYPAGWVRSNSLQGALLKAEDAHTSSAYKTTLLVEARALDPQSPPEMQMLVDRRTAQLAERTAFRFLADTQASVDGVPARLLEYAYVVQPIDSPRSVSVPVVVHAREYIVAAKTDVFYITLGAPETEHREAFARFDDLMKTVRMQ